MTSELLSLLESRLSAGLRFHEWREAALHGRAASTFLGQNQTIRHGHYLLVRAPSVPELWAALRAALATRVPLVILPPTTSFEEKILLRQLPESPPPGAALALFTVAANGEPRAVFHAEAALLSSARALAKEFPGAAPTASLLPAWSMGGLIFHCVLPAVRGSDVLFSREPFAQWAQFARSLFGELDLGLVSLNPTLLEALRHGGVDPSWKGHVVSLAAPLKRSALASFALATGRRPREIYGMAEAAGPVLLEGRALACEARVSANYELEIRGPQLFLGYGAGGTFQPHDQWFRTGDLFTAEEGIYLHQARERELIDLGPRQVAPRLFEEAVEEIPEIAECLAFSVEIEGRERVGLIYVRKQACWAPKEELELAVETCAQQKFSAEMRPGWWLEVPALPRLRNGKADRKFAKTQWASRARAYGERTSTS